MHRILKLISLSEQKKKKAPGLAINRVFFFSKQQKQEGILIIL